MKATMALFAFYFARALGGVIHANDSQLNSYAACLTEYGINHESEQELTVEQMSCIGACLYRDFGIMRADGTIDVETTQKHFEEDNTEGKEQFFKAYEACKDKTGCELVQCLLKEMHTEIESEDISANIGL